MEHQRQHREHQATGAYGTFALTLAVSFVVMYLVMYAMIAKLDDFYLNLGNVYMTAMMIAPMALVMLVAMKSMFPSRRANIAIGVLAAGVFVLGWWGMRSQLLVGNEQFLRSMIPHHSGAILMCEQAPITDPEIVALCGEIVKAQREEISRMRGLLAKR